MEEEVKEFRDRLSDTFSSAFNIPKNFWWDYEDEFIKHDLRHLQPKTENNETPTDNSVYINTQEY